MSELRFGRIVITDSTISEVEGRPLVTVERAEIRRVRLVHGVIAERPVVFIAMGILCAVVGLAGIAMLARGYFSRISIGLTLLLGGAPFMVMAGIRQGPVLQIETSRGTRKLGFGKRVQLAELPAFVADAKEQAGLAIERD